MISRRIRTRVRWIARLWPALFAAVPACEPPEPCEQHDNSNLGTQWIGIKSSSALKMNMTCEATLSQPSNWTGEALFVNEKGVAATGQLGKYCLYKHKTLGSVEHPAHESAPKGEATCAPEATHMDPVLALDQLTTLLVPGAINDLTQDSVIVAAQSQTSDLRTVHKYLRERLQEQTGGLATNAPPFVATDSSVHHVTTAILDSAPHKQDVSGVRAGLVPKIADTNDAHGSLMAFLANDRACPNGDASPTSESCGARTHTVLALPLRAPDIEDHKYGGHFGRRSDLARALYQTVVTYRDRFNDKAGDEARLVMSLSLAWEPTPGLAQVCGYNPGPSGNDSASLAVQDVLTFAACHGVTTIASSGNQAGNQSGRMCPADFENVPLPDAATCSGWVTYTKEVSGVSTSASFEEELHQVFPDWALSQPKNLKIAPFRRIVYSVGGVGPHDEPLAPVRAGSRPRFVEPAEGGVSALGALTSSPVIDEPPRSGTSVAAANLAGIVAGSLLKNPALTPPEVMELLYETGASTGLPVEACSQIGGAACDVTEARRPMLCSAIGAPCYQAPSGSGAVASTLSQALTNLASPLSASPMTLTPQAAFANVQTLTLVAAQPWVIEQPVRGGCPDCFWSAGQQEIDIINPAWASTPDSVVSLVFTLTVGTTNGTSTQDVYANGDTRRITGLPAQTLRVSMTAIDTDNLVVTQTIVGVP